MIVPADISAKPFRRCKIHSFLNGTKLHFRQTEPVIAAMKKVQFDHMIPVRDPVPCFNDADAICFFFRCS